MASKTKVYLAVIAAGLVALAVDRVYFGASAPSPIAASEVNSTLGDVVDESKPAPRSRPAPHPRAPQGPDTPGSKLSVPELHFPRNLPSYDPALEMRDVFAHLDEQGSFPNTIPTGKSGSAKKENAAEAIGREVFQAAHRVDAVMVHDSLKIAVVDGRWMRVGDVLDHCTLIRIEGDFTVFQCHDGDAVLSASGKRRQLPD
jgi:hypothetical protein